MNSQQTESQHYNDSQVHMNSQQTESQHYVNDIIDSSNENNMLNILQSDLADYRLIKQSKNYVSSIDFEKSQDHNNMIQSVNTRIAELGELKNNYVV